MGILASLRGTKTYFDTNVFIYALEGYADFLEELKARAAAEDPEPS